MKRIAFFLCLCLALLPLWASAPACSEEELFSAACTTEDQGSSVFYYTLNDKGEATLVGSERPGALAVLPDALDGHPVTGLADFALRYYSDWYEVSAESVFIPKDIASIGENPFANWQSLKEIVVDPENERFEAVDGALYDKLEKRLICCPLGREGAFTVQPGTLIIGEYAFGSDEDWAGYHSMLSSVLLPEGLTEIREGAFRSAAISEISVPASVRFIGDEAFVCSALTQLTLNEGLESIGRNAFSYTLLSEVQLPESLTYISKDSFARCEKLSGVNASDEITRMLTVQEEDRFLYSLDDEHNAMITGVSLIDAEDTLVLPATLSSNPVTAIADGAFSDLDEAAWYPIRKIVIPASVTQIGVNPFDGCMELELIEVDEANPRYVVQGGVLYDSIKREVVCLADRFSPRITLPEGALSVGAYAFNCAGAVYWSEEGLGEVVFPDTLVAIGEAAFSGCALSAVQFPASLKTIGASAFAWCDLQSVRFNEGLESIEDAAFYYAFAPECDSVALPESLSAIGTDAFTGAYTPVFTGSERVLALLDLDEPVEETAP